MEAFVSQTGRIVSQMNRSEGRSDTKCPISKVDTPFVEKWEYLLKI